METKSQLEARVLDHVATVCAGNKIEDDLVECKSSWPAVGKARQIGGLANKANGEPFLIIVGLDEKRSAVVQLDNTDPADWWSGLRSKFNDDTPPELKWHLAVATADREQVVALYFLSDRAPYVVRSELQGQSQLEVPIRDGTSTRSAYRHELLRLLLPSIHVPSITLTSATVTCNLHFERPATERTSGQSEMLVATARLGIYIEYVARDAVAVFPEHLMSASLLINEQWVKATRLYLLDDPDRAQQSNFSPWGCWSQRRQIACSASGPASIDCEWNLSPQSEGVVRQLLSVRLQLSLGIAGASRPAIVEAQIRSAPDTHPLPIASRRYVGRWELGLSDPP